MPANYKLIGEDMALTVAIGALWDGSLDPRPVGGLVAPAFAASPVSIMGTAKRVSLKSSLDKTNVKAMGDGFKKNRYHSNEQELEIEQFVPAIAPEIPASAVGKYIFVSYNPLSGGANGFIMLGVVTQWTIDAAVASEQSIKITVDLCPDYLGATAE